MATVYARGYEIKQLLDRSRNAKDNTRDKVVHLHVWSDMTLLDIVEMLQDRVESARTRTRFGFALVFHDTSGR